MALRVKDEGESQGRAVMARIRIARLISGNIIPRDTLRKRNGSEQTSLGCLGTREVEEPTNKGEQETAVT